MDTNNIFVLYEDKSLAVFKKDTYENIAHTDNSA